MTSLSSDYEFLIVDEATPRAFAEALAIAYNCGFRILQDERMHVTPRGDNYARYQVLVIRGGEDQEMH